MVEKSKSSAINVLSWVSFILLLGACVGSPYLPETPTSTSTGLGVQASTIENGVMPTRSATNEVTKTVEKTPIIIPTLTSTEMKERVSDLMVVNSNCELPCVWGFSPDKTSIKAIINFFTHLGWSTERFRGPQGNIIYTGADVDDGLSLRFAFYEVNELLDGISFAINRMDLVGEDQWLSLPNIFKTYGKPDEMWVNINLGGEMGLELIEQAGFDVYLFYKIPRFVIQYHGIAIHEKNTFNVCLLPDPDPNSTSNSTTTGVTVYSGSGDSIATPMRIIEPFGQFNGKYSLEEISHITIQELFETVMSDKEPCFSTPDNVWELK